MGMGRRAQEVTNHYTDGAGLRRGKKKKQDYVIMTQAK